MIQAPLRIFTLGDVVRVRLKSRAKSPNKIQSEQSSSYEVVSVKGVVVTFNELYSNRKYIIHHDRFSNLLCSGKPLDPRALEVTANPHKKEQDSEEGKLPVRDHEKALMCTRSGRSVKLTKNKDFELLFMLLSFNLSCPSVTSSIGAHLQSTLWTLKALVAQLLLIPSTTLFAYNQSHSVFQSPCITSGPCRLDKRPEFAVNSPPESSSSASKSSESPISAESS